MCGRFTLYADPDFLEGYFDIENLDDIEYESRYNIAPSQPVFTLVKGKEKRTRAGYLRWGLVPSWSKDLSIGNKMINARSETIHEKRSFRPLWKKRHCAIIASSFYEWKKEEDGKQPYVIKYKNDEPLIFAGLWERAFIDNKQIVTCTMLTTKANTFMSKIHHRMPVILPKQMLDYWLQPELLTEEIIKEIFEPLSSDILEMYKVSKLVNSPKNETIECIQPLPR